MGFANFFFHGKKNAKMFMGLDYEGHHHFKGTIPFFPMKIGGGFFFLKGFLFKAISVGASRFPCFIFWLFFLGKFCEKRFGELDLKIR